jgi:hypothetical protein
VAALQAAMVKISEENAAKRCKDMAILRLGAAICCAHEPR